MTDPRKVVFYKPEPRKVRPLTDDEKDRLAEQNYSRNMARLLDKWSPAHRRQEIVQ